MSDLDGLRALSEAATVAIIEAHTLTTPVQCGCGWRETDTEGEATYAQHLAARLAASSDAEQTLAKVRALADEFEGRVQMMKKRHKPTTADRREGNVWVLALHELHAVLDDAAPQHRCDQPRRTG